MEIAAVFLPLLGAFVAGFFGRFIGDRGAQIVTCTLMLIAAVLSCILFVEVGFSGPEATRTITLFTWIDSGSFEVDWALRIDALTAVMLVVVNVVSAMVHVYSVGYMSHDPSKARFMSYLSLFTFMMLMLVTADNLVQMFFGWEGVGLASYLLINFWYEKKSANDASMKAFLVNRVGDFGFALGIMAVFFLFGSVEFDAIFTAAPQQANATFNFLGFEVHALTAVCVLLFIGAMGKSAQLGLHTWLPDAMEGPTPVSALIHAATMVTAGVFMLARMSPLFEYAPGALAFVTVVGGLTAFIAATIGLTQFDIKRVIAYSTMSQLGYMFFAIGVGAYPAAIFHLMTHAFFKALLFLGAGSVIHAMSGEQDMRNMGGIWRLIPVTYGLMWIGNLALAGIIPFAGYYSKDMILEVAYADHSWYGTLAFWLGLAAALMTAFYSWRLLFLTFHGQPRANEKVMAHVHESPQVMLVPLYVLAVGAVAAGFVAYPWFVGHDMAHFWGGSILMLPDVHGETIIDAAHHVPGWVPLAPLGMGVLGIALAYLFYIVRPDLPAKTVAAVRLLHGIVFRKYYFDELYDAVFVKPAQSLGRGLWKGGDEAVIDGLGPDGLAAVTRQLAAGASRLQTGYVFHYAFVMVIGLVVLVGWFFLVR
ncbi:NADH-quinone oxidoreductase subunit L [Rhodospirillum centenum]|uniref:NADH-quinone oxidoreductase chain L n=1 Tax=Rhodospirillum centenum (strain ATCC 51521 / SW) TaxID=414684 RepID=B6ISX0_RHOCS|nr:NADH-quinone oxidoreductase subunit L [Rhodospirillum centenum]ACI98641.1 NADH-quinone oxidoreductase chain L [Rhodospirillum centenum SW]